MANNQSSIKIINRQSSMVNGQLSIVNKLRVVFFGGGRYVLPVLKTLNEHFKVALALTTEKNENEPISKFCAENKINCLRQSTFNKIVNGQLSIINAPVAILANFGLIIPKDVLDIFPKGILNIHPSLLPKYRGPTPVQTAILNGDKETGVTIIKLDEEIDHGPVVAKTEEPVFSADTSESLCKRLFEKGAQLLPKVLTEYINGTLMPKKQDHSKATFTKSLTRQDGYIDLNSQWSIINSQLSRMIRAYHPWPGVWTRFSKRGQTSLGKVIKFLPDKKLQVEGGKPMSYKDFLNGYPEAEEILNKFSIYNS